VQKYKIIVNYELRIMNYLVSLHINTEENEYKEDISAVIRSPFGHFGAGTGSD
jgi:hypothetical protein